MIETFCLLNSSFYYFLNTKRPAPDSELSICLINLAFSNKHDLRHKKLHAFHNINVKISDKCVIHIQSFVLKVEAEARFEGHGGTSEITCIFIFLIRVKN